MSAFDEWEMPERDEYALDSDIIFRGVRLRDKNVLTSVHFQHLTEAFATMTQRSLRRTPFSQLCRQLDRI